MIKIFVLTLILPLTVFADCTDPAKPNVDWQRCYFDGKNLTGIDISGKKTRIREASFTRGDLSSANLMQVYAHRAKFNTAKMKNINLKEATLTETDFTKADLEGANFEDADLRNAKMIRANLKKANLKNARVKDTDFKHADLSGATWTDGRICADGSIGLCK